MTTDLKKVDQSTFELTVELGKEELGRYVSNVERELTQNLTLDGFRKGKVPEDLARKHMDEKQVRELALQESVEHSLSQAISEQDLDVIKTSDLNIAENTSDRLKYTVKLSVMPRIELPDLAAFKAVRNPIEIHETEIQEALEVIRNWRSTFSAKEEEAKTGDRVEIDFTVRLDGKPLEGGDSKNHPLIIGGKNFMPGFEDQLVGMKKGDEKNFTIVAPADYYRKDLAGKSLEFSVKVNLLQQVNLPELNDTFAQGLGKFSGMDQLKVNVREGIEQEKKEKETQRVRLEVLEQIIAATKIETPDFLVQEHLNSMISNFDADLHAKGLELGMYLAQQGKTPDDLRKDWHKDAEKQAKIELILHAVAHKNKITVGEEELEPAVNQMVQALIARGQADPAQLNLDEMRRTIKNRLESEKTLEHIERTCVA